MTKYWRKDNYILFEVTDRNGLTHWVEYLYKPKEGNHKRISPRYARFKGRWNCTDYGNFPDENSKYLSYGMRRAYVYDEFCVYPGLNDL